MDIFLSIEKSHIAGNDGFDLCGIVHMKVKVGFRNYRFTRGQKLLPEMPTSSPVILLNKSAKLKFINAIFIQQSLFTNVIITKYACSHLYLWSETSRDEVDAVFPHTLNKLSLNASKGKKA